MTDQSARIVLAHRGGGAALPPLWRFGSVSIPALRRCGFRACAKIEGGSAALSYGWIEWVLAD
jgi:hypothetical protein